MFMFIKFDFARKGMCFCLAFEIALFRMSKLFEGSFISELSSAS